MKYLISADGELWHEVSKKELDGIVKDEKNTGGLVGLDAGENGMMAMPIEVFRNLANAPPVPTDAWGRPLELYGIPVVYE